MKTIPTARLPEVADSRASADVGGALKIIRRAAMHRSTFICFWRTIPASAVARNRAMFSLNISSPGRSVSAYFRAVQPQAVKITSQAPVHYRVSLETVPLS